MVVAPDMVTPPLAPPTGSDALQVVQISSLTAALAKLNVNIPIEDLIKAIHDEDEAKRTKLQAEASQRPRYVIQARTPAKHASCRTRDHYRLQVRPSLPSRPKSIRSPKDAVAVSSNSRPSPSPTARFQFEGFASDLCTCPRSGSQA